MWSNVSQAKCTSSWLYERSFGFSCIQQNRYTGCLRKKYSRSKKSNKIFEAETTENTEVTGLFLMFKLGFRNNSTQQLLISRDDAILSLHIKL